MCSKRNPWHRDGVDWDISKVSSHLQQLCVRVPLLLQLIIKHMVGARQGRESKVQQKKSARLIREAEDWHVTQLC